MLGITTTNARVGGFRGGISAEAKTIYNRIIADGGVSNLTRLNFFVKGLKAIYGDLANVPVCYDAHWIGYKLGSGTGATSGQAAAKLYSLTVAGDAVQATAASQPLLLAHNGDNYYQGVGVSGNNIITPNASANNITGDIEIIWNITSLNISTISQIVAKFGTSFCYNVYQWTSKRVIFETQYGSVTSTAHTLNSGDNCWFKITRQSSNGEHKFYQSTDGTSWTLFSTISGTSGALSTGGTLDVFKSDPQTAKLYRLTISNSIGGAPVVDFNPATYNASTSQTAWTSATGEIWTISTGTATSGYKGTLVDRVIVQSDGVDDYLDNTTFVRNDTMTQYLAYSAQAISSGAQAQIIDSSITNYNNSICQTASNMFSWLNGSLSNMSGSASIINRRNILAVNYNAGVNNNIKTNDIIGTINTYSPTPSGVGIRLFSKGGTDKSHNATITTYVYCINNDIANNTTMYNFLKTLNNL